MALVCTKIDWWIEDVWGNIQGWENRQEKRCKRYPWYDPRGWFCWLTVVVVEVFHWGIVIPGRWASRTICKWIATIVDIIKDVASGLWDIVVGIATLNWRRVVDGFTQILTGTILGGLKLLHIFLLGDTIDFIVGLAERGSLRDHISRRLALKYPDDTNTQQAIKNAIHFDEGAFGLRLHCTAYRSFLDSQTPSPTDRTAPNLVVLHETGVINLRELCGFEFNEGLFNRKRYKTLKKEIVVAGGGGGEVDNPITADELDTYLSSRGASGPAFTVLCMRDGVLDEKLDAATDKAAELGLMLAWDRKTVEVTTGEDIVHDGENSLNAQPKQKAFLTARIGRVTKANDPDRSIADLSKPAAVGVFRFNDGTRGLTSPYANSQCGLIGEGVSGVTFIDNQPDQVWKYVPIHELGHYFGLCHASGLDRIMVSIHDPSVSPWSWWLLPNLYLKAEPHFTLDEAKEAWTYIIDNFAPEGFGP